MKNKFTVLPALFLISAIGFGCSFIDNLSGGGASNTAGTSNTATDSADPNATAKTGIAECDELIDILNQDRADPNDGFLMRKAKELAIDAAKDTIKRNIEQNQGDKTRIAQGCREAKTEYLRNKNKNNQNQENSQQSGNF
jgi:hypothetical protein